jgi:hypothetical protein
MGKRLRERAVTCNIIVLTCLPRNVATMQDLSGGQRKVVMPNKVWAAPCSVPGRPVQCDKMTAQGQTRLGMLGKLSEAAVD